MPINPAYLVCRSRKIHFSHFSLRLLITFRTIRDLLILISVKLPKIPEDPKLPVLFSEPFIFRAPSSPTIIALYILACKLIQNIIQWLKTFIAYFLTIISQRDAKMSTTFDPEFRLDGCGMFFPLFCTNRWMILLKLSFCIIQIRLSDVVLPLVPAQLHTHLI